MMGDNSNSSNNGIGCFTILFFIFLTLKLTHYVDWSWWWVTAPMWGPVLIVAVIFGCVLIVHALANRA